jgi:hypothetical protein
MKMNDEIEKIVEKESGNASRGGIEGGSFLVGVITTLLYGVMLYAGCGDSIRDEHKAELRKSDVKYISAGDINGDGIEELGIYHSDGSITLYLRNEDDSYEEIGRMIPAEDNGE